MESSRGLRRWLAPGLLMVALTAMGCGNEQPGASGRPAEHPTPAGGETGLTKDDVASAIEAWVQEQGGVIQVEDEMTGETLELSLVQVHRERLSKVAADTYFACADFKTVEGKVYDLDVFVEGTDKSKLTFHDLTIHKEEGKERYTWYQEGGVWKKRPVESEAAATLPKPAEPEHPTEHPK